MRAILLNKEEETCHLSYIALFVGEKVAMLSCFIAYIKLSEQNHLIEMKNDTILSSAEL